MMMPLSLSTAHGLVTAADGARSQHEVQPPRCEAKAPLKYLEKKPIANIACIAFVKGQLLTIISEAKAL